MKTILLPFFLIPLTSPAFAAQTAAEKLAPMNLDSVDAVTAGTMVVTSNTTATWYGTASYAVTYADASVQNTPGGVIQIGRATGEAAVCCNVEVLSDCGPAG